MPSLDDLIEAHEPFEHKGEYYHKLRLKNGETVVSSSVINGQVAEWNAMIRLQCLIENGRIEIDGN